MTKSKIIPFAFRERDHERLVSMLERLDGVKLAMAIAYIQHLTNEPDLFTHQQADRYHEWCTRRNAWGKTNRPRGKNGKLLQGERFNKAYEKATGDHRR